MSTVLRLKNYFLTVARETDSDYLDDSFDFKNAMDSIKATTIFGIPLTYYIEIAEWIDENIDGGATINEKYKEWNKLDNVFIFSDDESTMAFKLRWI